MDRSAGTGERLEGGSLRWSRTTAAYSILLLGLAGSIAVVPVAIWAIAANGLQ